MAILDEADYRILDILQKDEGSRSQIWQIR